MGGANGPARAQAAQWVCTVALVIAAALQHRQLAALQDARASRHHLLDESVSQLREQVLDVRRALDGRADALHARVVGLEEALDAVDGERRRAQGREPEPEPTGLPPFELVKIIKPSVRRSACGAPGAGNIGGHFDMSRCADHAFEECNREACVGYNGDHSGGRRRLQSECDEGRIKRDSTSIVKMCCSESG